MEIYTIQVRSNPAQYSNQHHMYNFVSDLRQVIVFLWYSGFFHQKTDLDDIAEILLKVALNTITITPYSNRGYLYIHCYFFCVSDTVCKDVFGHYS